MIELIDILHKWLQDNYNGLDWVIHRIYPYIDGSIPSPPHHVIRRRATIYLGGDIAWMPGPLDSNAIYVKLWGFVPDTTVIKLNLCDNLLFEKLKEVLNSLKRAEKEQACLVSNKLDVDENVQREVESLFGEKM